MANETLEERLKKMPKRPIEDETLPIPRKLLPLYEQATPEQKEIFDDLLRAHMAQQTGPARARQAIIAQPIEEPEQQITDKDLKEYILFKLGPERFDGFKFLEWRRHTLIKLAKKVYDEKHMEVDDLYRYTVANIGAFRPRTFNEEYLGALYKLGIISNSNSIEWNQAEYDQFLQERKQK